MCVCVCFMCTITTKTTDCVCMAAKNDFHNHFLVNFFDVLLTQSWLNLINNGLFDYKVSQFSDYKTQTERSKSESQSLGKKL